MDRRTSLPLLAASSLLGVISSAAVVAAAFALFGAWVAADGSPIANDVGSAGAAVVGVLLLAFGVVAALAAHDTFVGRARGHVLGFVTSIVAILAAVAALLEGSSVRSDPLLYLAIGLGAITLVAVTVNVMDRSEPIVAARG